MSNSASGASHGAGRRRGLVLAAALLGALLFLGLATLGWGSWFALVAHPARAAFVALSVAFTLVALASPVNLSSGVREDTSGRPMLLLATAGQLLIFWLVPYCDRRDIATVDGDLARWVGLGLFAVGGVVRIWPIFVLGQRFSGLVAIQPGHELKTDGPYRHVRHPSYLGLLLALVGWALVFRSGVGLAASAAGLILLVQRMESEEALLAAHFGDAYETYRRRTWRLLPGVY